MYEPQNFILVDKQLDSLYRGGAYLHTTLDFSKITH